MKHIRKFNKMNENLIVTPDLEYHNKGKEVSIEDYLPNFYQQNRERVDSGKIKFFYDGYATEVGCLIDLDTLETYIIDTRA